MDTPRQRRMQARNRRNTIQQLLGNCGKDSVKAAKKARKAARVQFLNRHVGAGSVGFRHRNFTNQRRTQMINLNERFEDVGKVQVRKYYKNRPSNPGKRDEWFECRHLYGDRPWLMDVYARYLSEHVLQGDVARLPTDAELCNNFKFFWESVVAYFNVGTRDVPIPACAP